MNCNLGEGEGVDIQEAIDTETWEGRKTRLLRMFQTEPYLWFKVVKVVL